MQQQYSLQCNVWHKIWFLMLLQGMKEFQKPSAGFRTAAAPSGEEVGWVRSESWGAQVSAQSHKDAGCCNPHPSTAKCPSWHVCLMRSFYVSFKITDIGCIHSAQPLHRFKEGRAVFDITGATGWPMLQNVPASMKLLQQLLLCLWASSLLLPSLLKGRKISPLLAVVVTQLYYFAVALCELQQMNHQLWSSSLFHYRKLFAFLNWSLRNKCASGLEA